MRCELQSVLVMLYFITLLRWQYMCSSSQTTAAACMTPRCKTCAMLHSYILMQASCHMHEKAKHTSDHGGAGWTTHAGAAAVTGTQLWP